MKQKRTDAIRAAALDVPELTDKAQTPPNFIRRNIFKLVGAAGAGYLLSAAEAKADDRASRLGYSGRFEVSAFGAVGDGNINDTDAINRAISYAGVAGGTVFFPAGTYLSHSIRLKSNVTLELAPGCIIRAAGDAKYDFPEPNEASEAYQDFGHNHWHNSLIWGEGLENIAIIGQGLIQGDHLSRGEGKGPIAENKGVGNKAIALKNCRNVLLRDFSVFKGGTFAILATGVDNLTVDNLRVDTNRDGIDIDCCRNVHISNCSFNTPWDDAIVLKSSYALGYCRSTEAVTISNCYVTGGYQIGSLLNASFKPFIHDDTMTNDAWIRRIGRIKFGTESNGGFKNIAISNCVFEHSYGIAIESVDGAEIENITITNITMQDTVVSPIFIRLGSRLRGPKDILTGFIRRVMITNVVCSGASQYTSVITGVPGHPIEDVTLSNIYVQHVGDQQLITHPDQVPELENAYPEAGMFGVTPAQGLYARHVKGLTASNINVSATPLDMRPLFILQDAQNVLFSQISSRPPTTGGTFVLDNVRDFRVTSAQFVPDTFLDRVATKTL